jgi:hypothetical protein
MDRLRIYGDFNCPFSALASARADLLLDAGRNVGGLAELMAATPSSSP